MNCFITKTTNNPVIVLKSNQVKIFAFVKRLLLSCSESMWDNSSFSQRFSYPDHRFRNRYDFKSRTTSFHPKLPVCRQPACIFKPWTNNKMWVTNSVKISFNKIKMVVSYTFYWCKMLLNRKILNSKLNKRKTCARIR